MTKRFRVVRTPIHFARLFEREGLEKRTRIQTKINLSELHDASIFLFKHILNPSDVRWKLATKYAELKKQRNFKPINLENGLRAVYSSRSQGRNKNRGASITGTIHVLQLTRALRNIEIGNEYFAFRKPIKLDSKYEVRFEKTNSILKQIDKYGLNGCPEALWQLQLWSSNKYIGRIGINFHTEGEKNIITIANIQGAIGKKVEQQEFEKKVGSKFGEELIKILRTNLGPNFEYRGAIPHNKNLVQYKMSFRKAKPKQIKIWDNKMKTMIEDRRKK
ncbi:MAG: hypothetical protein PHP82_01625 [Candidatus ainarchaeum sp.]|nr:hypothetical protein [Candidatus ainarchaeum sp.]